MRPFALVVGAVLAASMLSGCVLNIVGSDTTSSYMGSIASSYNADATANPGGDVVRNTPPTLAPGGSFSIPSDFDAGTGFGCPAFNYTNPGNLPPNGSSAGINALLADTQTCVDIARSSRGRGSEGANIDFWAYATDGVTWAEFGGVAPNNLTLAQLRGIYLCDQPGGDTLYDNWNQVGGANAPILRFLPQLLSGTLSFFETKVLGLSSAQQGVLDDSACSAGNGISGRVQENSGAAVPAGSRPNAIVPYSFGVWTAQANGVETDNRAGAALGQINGVAPTTTSIGVNGAFFAKRYVYNVLKNTSVTNDVSLRMVGVKAGQVGYICKNTAAVSFVKATFGFSPLSIGATGPAGLPNSTCRKNPAAL